MIFWRQICMTSLCNCARKLGRLGCPNFGHPFLTSSYTKYKFLQVKNIFAAIVMDCKFFVVVSAFEYFRRMPTASPKFVIPKLGAWCRS